MAAETQIPIQYVTREEMMGLVWQAGQWVQEDLAKNPTDDLQILGVARGGLFLAFYLSKITGGKLYSIPVSSYETGEDGLSGKQIKEPLVDPDDIPVNLNPRYVAEDLIETGGTMKAIKEPFPDAKRIGLFSKLSSTQTAELFHFCPVIVKPVEVKEGEVIEQVMPWLRFHYDEEVQQVFPNAPV